MKIAWAGGRLKDCRRQPAWPARSVLEPDAGPRDNAMNGPSLIVMDRGSVGKSKAMT
jgi:hypothetical protein